MSKQKLALTWIGKEKRPKLEPRILLEDLEKSYHAKHRVTDSDIFDNRLIFGDNLLALKAVELGEHCHTHIIPRLKKVINGEDQGGISKAVNWQGGGGFRYYKLAPSLIINDRWGNPVINPEYNAAMLAEALAKLEGFTYAPSETNWWQHGHSSERDFIYVTTQNLSAEQLQALSDEVGQERSLLVCCAAFHGVTAGKAAERWPNLTLKKIPKMVLARCEWGHDDYSLNVANLPLLAPIPAQPPPAGERGKTRRVNPAQGSLFGEES